MQYFLQARLTLDLLRTHSLHVHNFALHVKRFQVALDVNLVASSLELLEHLCLNLGGKIYFQFG
jgi:hypothetical protein